VLTEKASAIMIDKNQVQTGASLRTKTVKIQKAITFTGITRTNIALCPIRSATLDQCGVAKAITTDAVALNAPAIAYESLTATTIKIRASESIEIGMRAMRPGIENLIAPGKRNRVM
jgi:hypothetical protein